MDPRDLLICWTLLVASAASDRDKSTKLKMCIAADPVRDASSTIKSCNALSTLKESPVACTYRGDRLGCMDMVWRREADFTVADPEDLYMSSVWGRDKMLVVSEVRDDPERDFRFGCVVIARNASDGSLRGKRLCHPGLRAGDDAWNHLFAEYFEDRIAPRNCEPGLSVYEDRAKTSAEFFDASCKAGAWVNDAAEDARLKNQYDRLCGACDYGDCRVGDKYAGHVGGVLCLADQRGNILWARYDRVVSAFAKMHADGEISMSDYSLVCEDGARKSLDDGDPCFWLAMPWRVLAANSASVKSVQRAFADFGTGEWEQQFMRTIESFVHYVVMLSAPKTTEDYLKTIPGYVSAMNLSQGNCRPGHAVRMCTSSPVDHDKCTWLTRAALSVAIQPPMECVLRESELECLDSVANSTSDVAVVRPDFLCAAERKYKLRTLYAEMGRDVDYGVSAVAKSAKKVKRMSDLKSTKACFTRVDGAGWNSAVSAFKEEGLASDACPQVPALMQVFGDVCVVRRDDPKANVSECCGGGGNATDPDADALECLDRDGCSVAFVDSLHATGSKALRSICRGKDSSNCPWYTMPLSHLMIRADVEGFKMAEIDGLLSRLTEHFGSSATANGIMRMFGSFQGVDDVLFRSASTKLSKDWVDEYENVLSCAEACNSGVGASPSRLLATFAALVLAALCRSI